MKKIRSYVSRLKSEWSFVSRPDGKEVARGTVCTCVAAVVLAAFVCSLDSLFMGLMNLFV